MKINDKTKTLLIEDLKKQPESPQRNRIIERAQIGFYHDFECSIATPKIQLVMDLNDAGFNDMGNDVKQGKYD